MRGFLRFAVAACLAFLCSTPARAQDVCTSETHALRALASAKGKGDEYERKRSLRDLFDKVGLCDPRPAWFRPILQASAIEDYDGERSWGTAEKLFAAMLLAREAGRRQDLFEVAWRWARETSRFDQFIGVANMVNAEMEAELRDRGGSLPSLPFETLRGTALLAPVLCSRLYDVAITPDTPLPFDEQLAALECLAKNHAPQEFRTLLVKLAGAVNAPANEENVRRLEILLAHATSLGDFEAARPILERAGGLAVTMDKPLRDRLALARAVAFAEFGKRGEATQALVSCTGGARRGADHCLIAKVYVRLMAGENEALASLEEWLLSRFYKDSPSLAFPALRYVEVAVARGATANLRKLGSYGDIGQPNLVRACLTAEATRDLEDLQAQLSGRGGVLHWGAANGLLECMKRLLPGLPADRVAEILPHSLPILQRLPIDSSAPFRLLAGRALLAQVGQAYLEPPKALVEPFLQPVATEAATPAQRAEALRLLLRLAIDLEDPAEAAALRARLRAAGATVPATLAEGAPRPPGNAEWGGARKRYGDWSSRTLEENLGWSGRRYSANSRNALELLSIAVKKSAAEKEARSAADLAEIAALRSEVRPADLRTDPECLTAEFDEARAGRAIVGQAQNDRINSLMPNLSEMRRYFGLLGRADDNGLAPFRIQRSARTLMDAIEDLEHGMQIRFLLGQPERALEDYRYLEDLRRSLPSRSVDCLNMQNVSDRTEQASAALIGTIADLGDALPDQERLLLVADALQLPAFKQQLFRGEGNAEIRRLNRDLYRSRRNRGHAITRMDVEAVRAAQVAEAQITDRLTAAQGPRRQARQTLALRLQAARAALGPDHALIAWKWLYLDRPRLFSIVITRDSVRAAHGEGVAPEFRKDVLQLSAPRSGTRIPDFDLEKAHQIYLKTFANLGLENKRRLYVIEAPEELPTGLLVTSLAAASNDINRRYRESAFLLDAFDIVHLGPRLEIPATSGISVATTETVVFASPDYGPEIPGAAMVDLVQLDPEPAGPARVSRQTCGLPPLGDFAAELRDAGLADQSKIFAGPQAREDRLAELQDDGTLKRAGLLVFYAHGIRSVAEDRRDSDQGIALLPSSGCETEQITMEAEGDGFLAPEEAGALDLAPSAWVMLAGCDTAKPGSSQEGSMLPVAFLAAGAQAVIGSVVEVPADSTAYLTQEMVRGHAEADPVKTLFATLRSMRQQSRDDPGLGWDHPIFWGAWKIMVR